LGLLGLTACGRGLDTAAIEAEIQADIERQGYRLRLDGVDCPRGIPRLAEGYFRCVGELAIGGQFTIHVTQQDEQGTVNWEVPNSAVLLNLARVETDIQAGLSQSLGAQAVVDCGDLYRANVPGDVFECQVVGGIEVDAARVSAVVVQVNPEGDLTWHEVRQAIAPAIASTPTDQPAEGTPQSAAPAPRSTATAAVPGNAPVEAAPPGTAGSRKTEFRPPAGAVD
jgi:hypothetical protein